MTRPSLIPLALSLSLACASAGSSDTAPPPTTVNRVYVPGGWGMEMYNEPGLGGRTIPIAPGVVWHTLPGVYEALGVPEALGDREGMVFGQQGFRARRIEGKRLSTYVDCGSGVTATPNADQYQVTMTLLTQLVAAEAGRGTVVTTTVDANAQPREYKGNPVHCQSKGVIEMRVIQLIARMLQDSPQ